MEYAKAIPQYSSTVVLHPASSAVRWEPCSHMAECRSFSIVRLTAGNAIDLSTDWLEIQYLMGELDQLKALYEDAESEAA